jgi:hypothetical protein
LTQLRYALDGNEIFAFGRCVLVPRTRGQAQKSTTIPKKAEKIPLGT